MDNLSIVLTPEEKEKAMMLRIKKEIWASNPELVGVVTEEKFRTYEEVAQELKRLYILYEKSPTIIHRQIPNVSVKLIFDYIKRKYRPTEENLKKLLIQLSKGLVESPVINDVMMTIVCKEVYKKKPSEIDKKFVNFIALIACFQELFKGMGTVKIAKTCGLNRTSILRFMTWQEDRKATEDNIKFLLREVMKHTNNTTQSNIVETPEQKKESALVEKIPVTQEKPTETIPTLNATALQKEGLELVLQGIAKIESGISQAKQSSETTQGFQTPPVDFKREVGETIGDIQHAFSGINLPKTPVGKLTNEQIKPTIDDVCIIFTKLCKVLHYIAGIEDLKLRREVLKILKPHGVELLGYFLIFADVNSPENTKEVMRDFRESLNRI